MNNSNDDIAANLIRQKLAGLYAHEPNARQEMQEVTHENHRSKHQQFMYNLSRSGKSLAEIQTTWHEYYVALPDDEKHQVWREFYHEHNRRQHTETPPPEPTIDSKPHSSAPRSTSSKTIGSLQQQLLHKIRSQAKPQHKQHLKSLGFGLACGFVVVILILFSFFNERFVAPFITPSKAASNAPLIIDSTTSVSKDPEIIIPKINVQIPVDYKQTSINEQTIEKALESGVVHYPTTASPGEKGHGAIFGHSSNNIFNTGRFKFAFVMLKRLETGDTFILNKDGVRYVYKVFDKRIVPPTEVSVLGGVGSKAASFSLITCDPPGTSLNRLVVTGEQISPDPGRNIASSAKHVAEPATLPSNAPTLWHRLWSWLSS